MYVIGRIAVWAGAIIPALFLIRYTWLTRFGVLGRVGSGWWRTVSGQTIVALDIALMTVFIVTLVEEYVFNPPQHRHVAVMQPRWGAWLVVLSVLAVPCIVLYRWIALEVGYYRRCLSRKEL